VRVDSQGYVWVERHVPAGDSPVLDVFDGAGDPVGSIEIPVRSSLRGFGDGTLYLTRWDDLGFQWLERYGRPSI
jgi:sugar lactone lactonase YvrE